MAKTPKRVENGGGWKAELGMRPPARRGHKGSTLRPGSLRAGSGPGGKAEQKGDGETGRLGDEGMVKKERPTCHRRASICPPWRIER